MSSVLSAPSATTLPGEQSLRDGFPGRTVTAIALLSAPPLALLGAGLGAGSYDALGSAFMAGMHEQHVLANVGMQCAQAAMIVLIIAVAGLAGMATGTHPRLARAAGTVTIIGLCGPISFESLYWGAWHLTGSAAHREAAAVMLDTSQVIPQTVMNVTGPALVVGFILLAVVMARAGILGRTRAICLGATCLIPAGFISGYLVISLVAFAGTAIALVPLGVKLLARHRGE